MADTNALETSPYQDPDWLYRLYWEEGNSTPIMAEMAGCTHGTILRWMDRLGIARRSLSESAQIAERMLPEDRFWSKVNIGEEDECWEWMAYCKRNGYGQFHIGRRPIYAHRMAWELTYGKIPEGLLVCHACDNPTCCNPSHLFLGTYQDNNDDMWRKERGLCGEQVGNSKLTESQVLEIRDLWQETDYTQAEIGEMFGVHRATVGLITQRRNWTWLQGERDNHG